MKDEPDYLERLTCLSPVNDLDVSPEARCARPTSRTTRREKLVVLGLALIFVCGLLIFWMYGLASLTDTDPRDTRYWPEVFGKMFAFHYGGSVAIPASLGLVLGIALLLSGIIKIRQ